MHVVWSSKWVIHSIFNLLRVTNDRDCMGSMRPNFCLEALYSLRKHYTENIDFNVVLTTGNSKLTSNNYTV